MFFRRRQTVNELGSLKRSEVFMVISVAGYDASLIGQFANKLFVTFGNTAHPEENWRCSFQVDVCPEEIKEIPHVERATGFLVTRVSWDGVPRFFYVKAQYVHDINIGESANGSLANYNDSVADPAGVS